MKDKQVAKLEERLAAAMLKRAIVGPAQLGRKVGVNRQTASKWINGETKIISAADLFKLADALEVSARWLLGWDAPIERRQRVSAEESRLLDVYRALLKRDPEKAEAWVAEGDEKLELVTIRGTRENPYPRAIVKDKK